LGNCEGGQQRDLRVEVARVLSITAASRYNEGVMLLPTTIENAVRAYQGAIAREFPSRLVRIVVFGSVARGEATEDSDVDILVVLDRLTTCERARVIDLGAEIAFDRRLLFSPLPLSVDEWSDIERRERLLATEINRDGIQV
jgi:predicted nucleotidyltransferase